MLPPEPGCYAIVLAAGASTRFGGAKLIAVHRDRPLVHWAVTTALACKVERVFVILGARADQVRSALVGMGKDRLSFVACDEWQDGLSASLKCGIAALPQDAKAVLLFLGDMPDCDPALANELLDEVIAGAPAALPDFDGQAGHPVAFSHETFAGVAILEGDKGARALLESMPGIKRIRTQDQGCVRDIDRPDDMKDQRYE